MVYFPGNVVDRSVNFALPWEVMIEVEPKRRTLGDTYAGGFLAAHVPGFSYLHDLSMKGSVEQASYEM
jgi:hypothetical protein